MEVKHCLKGKERTKAVNSQQPVLNQGQSPCSRLPCIPLAIQILEIYPWMLQLRGTGDPKILYFIADEVFLGSSSTWTSLRTKLFHFPPGPDSATPPLSSSFFGWEGRLWRGRVFRLLPWLAFTLASSQTREGILRLLPGQSSTEGAWGCLRQQNSWMTTGWHYCPSCIPDQHPQF